MPFETGRVFQTLAQRFDTKVERHDADCPCCSGCWLWTGFVDKAGYARLREAGRGSPVLYAHRYSYEIHVGPIPKGLTLDHVRERGCVHRHCVNPAHLEAVTNAENARRANVTTHCEAGHERTVENTQLDRRGRVAFCKICRRDRRRAASAR